MRQFEGPPPPTFALFREMEELSIMPVTITYNMVFGALLRKHNTINRQSNDNGTNLINRNKQ